MYHLLEQSVTVRFVLVGFARFRLQTAIISLNSVNKQADLCNSEVRCLLRGTGRIIKYISTILCSHI
jgi:hypothetical protein